MFISNESRLRLLFLRIAFLELEAYFFSKFKNNTTLEPHIKSFTILAALRRSVKRVCRAYLHIIVPEGYTAPFEEMLQRWQAIGKTAFDLTGPRFEAQTSRCRDERVTAGSTGR